MSHGTTEQKRATAQPSASATPASSSLTPSSPTASSPTASSPTASSPTASSPTASSPTPLAQSGPLRRIGPHVPEWVKHAVFYQIFPDRFARSTRTKLPRGLAFKEWGAPPEEQGFHGGDLLGIVDRLDYLLELGINALYLNPVFASASNHRYHTFDYFSVDPILGGDAALRELLDAAHANGLRVVLDGVFNHASRGFWPFHHILETGGDSPYLDWFYVRDWPLKPYPPDGDTNINYDAWWGLPALPKLNVANPGMRAYLLKAAEHWIEFGADGWRLDVPEEIDDAEFWRAFRRLVKKINPDAYLVGEIWHEAQDWLAGDRFDAVMNYVFSRAAYGFFGAQTLHTDYRPGGYALETLDATGFAQEIEEMCNLYDWEITLAQLNLMDSHDTARLLWTVGEDESAARLCVLFQMTMPGAPCIYYGGELGMTGATDPYCRAAFPWHDHRAWNESLLAHHRRAIAMRNRHEVLRTGTLQTVYAQDNCYGVLRQGTQETALALFNAGQETVHIPLLDLAQTNFPGKQHGRDESTPGDGTPTAATLDGIYRDVWNRGEYRMVDARLQEITVPPRDAIVLIKS